MAPTLKVLLPTSGSAYPPTEPSQVNSVKAIPIETPGFKGEISIWVKDYNGLHKKGDGHEYFEQNGRKNNTYAVIAKGEWKESHRRCYRLMTLSAGRFLKPISADDILFGNVFEKPIRDSLPWGTSIAMKFMKWVAQPAPAAGQLIVSCQLCGSHTRDGSVCRQAMGIVNSKLSSIPKTRI